jgi:hypothetical protein
MSLCGLGVVPSCLCEHDVDINRQKFHLCELHKQIIALTDIYKGLSISIVGYQDFKIRQIDENRKLSRRLDELENGLIKRVGILGRALHELSEDNHKLRKIPYKCPICYGRGVACNTCDGKGIVWG